MSRDTVLFYCQHLLGVGHISRSLAICRALLDSVNVVFIQGGPDIGRTIASPYFTHVFLPPILMREHDSSLYDPLGESSLDDLWASRKAALDPILNQPFASVVVELFPFGRNKFKPEILEVIRRARTANPRTKIYCSNRDIMVQKPDQDRREGKIVSILSEHFDHVLVHSDPKLIAMDETFGATPQIADQIIYTGYVADPTPTPPGLSRLPRILVSLGGGAVGDELARACVQVADRFPGFEMRVLTGPYTSDAFAEELAGMAQDRPTVSVHGFAQDFRAELAQAQLSISLAGYNTIMDLLATKTPALVYPYMANREQNMRAQALADLGLMGMLFEPTLEPDALEAAVRAQLSAPRPDTEIDLSGATTSARVIADPMTGQSPTV